MNWQSVRALYIQTEMAQRDLSLEGNELLALQCHMCLQKTKASLILEVRHQITYSPYEIHFWSFLNSKGVQDILSYEGY